MDPVSRVIWLCTHWVDRGPPRVWGWGRNLYSTPTQMCQRLALVTRSVRFIRVKLTEQSEDTFYASNTAKLVVRLSSNPWPNDLDTICVKIGLGVLNDLHSKKMCPLHNYSIKKVHHFENLTLYSVQTTNLILAKLAANLYFRPKLCTRNYFGKLEKLFLFWPKNGFKCFINKTAAAILITFVSTIVLTVPLRLKRC